MAQQLILKRVSRAGPSGEWNKADYDVVADGIVVKAAAVPVGMSWMWTLGFGHHEESSADAWLRGKSDQPWPRADSVSQSKADPGNTEPGTPGARFAFYMPDFGISSYSRPTEPRPRDPQIGGGVPVWAMRSCKYGSLALR